MPGRNLITCTQNVFVFIYITMYIYIYYINILLFYREIITIYSLKIQYMNYYSAYLKQMFLFYVPIYDTNLKSGLVKRTQWLTFF